MRALARFIYFKVWGWTLSGTFPEVPKCVVIIVPHTSWWDFVLGLLVREMIGIKIHYVAKQSLFRPPFGWLFKWLGGAPIDRSRSKDTVNAITRIFDERKIFRLALSPEGTRKKVSTWKTGFYYIAIKANVPIVMVAFDFGRKQVKFSQLQYPTGNIDTDLKVYMAFYKGVVGKIPQNSF